MSFIFFFLSEVGFLKINYLQFLFQGKDKCLLIYDKNEDTLLAVESWWDSRSSTRTEEQRLKALALRTGMEGTGESCPPTTLSRCRAMTDWMGQSGGQGDRGAGAAPG